MTIRERPTGATNVQIDTAVQRTIDDLLGYEFGDVPNCTRRTNEAVARWAGRLVPKDHRIVSVADLNALLALIDWLVGIATVIGTENDDLLDRIRDLIGDSRPEIPA